MRDKPSQLPLADSPTWRRCGGVTCPPVIRITRTVYPCGSGVSWPPGETMGGLLSLRSHRQLIYTLAAEHSSADSYSSQQQPDSTAVTAVVPVHRSLEAYKVGLAHRMQTLAAAQCTAMDACQWIPPPFRCNGPTEKGSRWAPALIIQAWGAVGEEGPVAQVGAACDPVSSLQTEPCFIGDARLRKCGQLCIV